MMVDDLLYMYNKFSLLQLMDNYNFNEVQDIIL